MSETITRSSVHEKLNERKFYSRFSMNSLWCGLDLSFAFICDMEFHDNGVASNSLLSKNTLSIILETYITLYTRRFESYLFLPQVNKKRAVAFETCVFCVGWAIFKTVEKFLLLTSDVFCLHVGLLFMLMYYCCDKYIIVVKLTLWLVITKLVSLVVVLRARM